VPKLALRQKWHLRQLLVCLQPRSPAITAITCRTSPLRLRYRFLVQSLGFLHRLTQSRHSRRATWPRPAIPLLTSAHALWPSRPRTSERGDASDEKERAREGVRPRVWEGPPRSSRAEASTLRHKPGVFRQPPATARAFRGSIETMLAMSTGGQRNEARGGIQWLMR
jgi:hypothetical protein